MPMLGKGDGDVHDRMIATEATKLPGTCSSIRCHSVSLFPPEFCSTSIIISNLIVSLNPEDCSVICLAQYSMARAAPLVRDALKRGPLGSVPVLTSPDSAVAKLARTSKTMAGKY